MIGGDVMVSLRASADCAVDAAIRTADGRSLSVTVARPVGVSGRSAG
ncbi:MAG: hypothetical protein OXU81_13550 [Gammaproteobacteria bacterium]|nr:hypothetical protein [Gammaproteobacteria bacterium]